MGRIYGVAERAWSLVRGFIKRTIISSFRVSLLLKSRFRSLWQDIFLGEYDVNGQAQSTGWIVHDRKFDSAIINAFSADWNTVQGESQRHLPQCYVETRVSTEWQTIFRAHALVSRDSWLQTENQTHYRVVSMYRVTFLFVNVPLRSFDNSWGSFTNPSVGRKTGKKRPLPLRNTAFSASMIGAFLELFYQSCDSQLCQLVWSGWLGWNLQKVLRLKRDQGFLVSQRLLHSVANLCIHRPTKQVCVRTNTSNRRWNSLINRLWNVMARPMRLAIPAYYTRDIVKRSSVIGRIIN